MVLRLIAPLAMLVLAACAQNTEQEYRPPEKGDSAYLKAENARADAMYLNAEADSAAADFRDVYIERADLANIRIIQPEGAGADEEWRVNDIENDILQRAILREFSTTLGFQSAYNIVESRDDAQILIHTTVVAIHPYASRTEVASGIKSGGAITASIALVNARTGVVMVRAVDTRSSDDIWAFHQVDNDDPAYSLIFRSWGNSIRRGMLHLQGRSSDPLAQPVLLQKQ